MSQVIVCTFERKHIFRILLRAYFRCVRHAERADSSESDAAYWCADHGHRLSSHESGSVSLVRSNSRGAAVRSTAFAPTARPVAQRNPAQVAPDPGPFSRACLSSRGADEGSSQVLIDCLLGDPERTSNADRLQFAGVHQAIHGHLRHAHDQGHFGNREESNVAKGSIACHAVASSARSRALDGIQRTSHVRLQRKSCTKKSNPVPRSKASLF